MPYHVVVGDKLAKNLDGELTEVYSEAGTFTDNLNNFIELLEGKYPTVKVRLVKILSVSPEARAQWKWREKKLKGIACMVSILSEDDGILGWLTSSDTSGVWGLGEYFYAHKFADKVEATTAAEDYKLRNDIGGYKIREVTE